MPGRTEELGNRADPTWARQVSGSLAGDLAVGFGATIPLNTETEWDEVKHAWAVDRHGRPAKDRYGAGADRVNDINEDQLRIIRTLLGTLLLIRQPADARRALWQAEQVRPDAAARKRLRRPVPSTPMPRSTTSRSASPSTPHPTTTAVPATPPAASTATSGSYGRTAAPTPTMTTRWATPASGSALTSSPPKDARTLQSLAGSAS
ncbi:hypothetical protein [Streptomyces sp. NPDC087437]|uniref:hypothetical protein n=1 Tax=Streptomyces sp. NPDC087437 TaxID=3365789 RepID=UPI00382B7421